MFCGGNRWLGGGWSGTLPGLPEPGMLGLPEPGLPGLPGPSRAGLSTDTPAEAPLAGTAAFCRSQPLFWLLHPRQRFLFVPFNSP